MKTNNILFVLFVTGTFLIDAAQDRSKKNDPIPNDIKLLWSFILRFPCNTDALKKFKEKCDKPGVKYGLPYSQIHKAAQHNCKETLEYMLGELQLNPNRLIDEPGGNVQEDYRNLGDVLEVTREWNQVTPLFYAENWCKERNCQQACEVLEQYGAISRKERVSMTYNTGQ